MMNRLSVCCAALLLGTTTVIVPAITASAFHEPTLVVENESSTSALSGSVTDGEYVVWDSTSTSVHGHCSFVRAARLDDREPFSLMTMADAGAVAVDGGLAAISTPSVSSCTDGAPDGVSGGLTLVDLATGEAMLLAEGEFTDVVLARLGGDSADMLQGSSVGVAQAATDLVPLAVFAMSESTGFELVEVVAYDEGTVELLHVENNQLYWVYWLNGEGTVGTATIGGDPTYIMSLNAETTEVAVAGNVLMTITNDRPLFHDLNTGATRWLGDAPASYVTTDGRYVFWATISSDVAAITGYDLQTDTRFTTWEARDDPANVGRAIDLSARGGALAWTHYAYNTWMTAIHAANLSDRLPSAAEPPPGQTNPDQVYFSETGHALGGEFLNYWSGNGGLPVFGFPLTSEYQDLSSGGDVGYTAQFTERQRLEWHPDNAGTPYVVLLGRLGNTLLQLQGRDWMTFPKADPNAEHYFPETGHAIAAEFWGYWSSHGLDFGDEGVGFRESLALFGYPLSEPMTETNSDGDTVLTQYFERAVFEYHSDNAAPYQVLLRRLGAEVLASWGW